MRLFLLATALATIVLAAVPPRACAQAGTISIDHAWSRPAIAGRPGVVYLTITDTGAPDTLTEVETPVAQDAMLHQSSEDHGVMQMRPVGALAVAPGKPARLAPGGLHVMLMGLRHALLRGETFPVTLTFAHAGRITTTVTVEQPGTVEPPGG